MWLLWVWVAAPVRTNQPNYFIGPEIDCELQEDRGQDLFCLKRAFKKAGIIYLEKFISRNQDSYNERQGANFRQTAEDPTCLGPRALSLQCSPLTSSLRHAL